VDQLELGIALLFIGANVLIISYATKAHMGRYAVMFYAVWITGLIVLPAGGAQWFWLIIFASTALRSGRLLVVSQRQAKSEGVR